MEHLSCRARRAIRAGLLSACILAATAATVEAMLEHQFLYFPDRDVYRTPGRAGLAYEDVFFPADDGTRIHGWFVAGDPGQPLLLFFHGNAGNIADRVENLRYLHRLGLNVFIIDYRGYGNSEGRTSEKGTASDARGALAWAREKGWTPDRMIYFGRSLGAGVAVQLATEAPPAGLVLETPFTSIRDMGRFHYPILSRLLGWALEARYDNLEKIPRIQVPLLLIQGDRDSIVPEAMARRLFAAANEPKRYHLIRGADHNDTYYVGGEAYWDAWRQFLEDISPP